ncbi:hypothetical protein ACFX58_03470 [Sphingomonas sp. NCPPB 2930]
MTTTKPTGNAAASAEAPATKKTAAAQVDATTAVPDENHGRGGVYELRDGKRVLVDRTQEAGPEADDTAPQTA